MIPSLNITATAEATLAERLLLNDPIAWSSLPDHFTDEDWRKEAQAVVDGDDRDFLWMLREGREADARRERQWRYEQRTGKCGDDLPLSAFCDIYEGARHPLQSTYGMGGGA